MTMRSLSKNVEILPESSEDSLVIRLSETYSERLKLRIEDSPKARAMVLEEMILEIWGEDLCPFCDGVIPEDSRFCIFCGKAIDPFAREYERKQQLLMQEMKEMKEKREMEEMKEKEAER